MKIGEQQWEQAQVEEQEEEESSLLVRKPRAGNDSKTTEIAAVDVEVSNGVSEGNGRGSQPNVAENGAKHEDPSLEKEQKIEELDWILEDELEAINWEQNTEKLDGVHENESNPTNGDQKIKELDELLENESKELDGVFENESKAINEEHKIKELDGVLENEPKAINGEEKIDELDGVLENGSQAINGEPKIEGVDGLLENESETINGEPEIKGVDGHLENESKTINGEEKSKNLVFHDKVEGVESTSAYFGEKQITKDLGHHKLDISSPDSIAQNNSTSEINNILDGDLKKNLQPSQVSFQENSSSNNKSSNEIESAEVDLINEDDVDATDYDVETVIQKQNTHDLYCPNCNSCITRRVIIRKRKRRIRITDEEVKRNKIRDGVGLKPGVGSVHAPIDQVHDTDEVGFGDYTQIPREDDEERPRGPAIFRCLSCFSIFIPTGKGFKLFGERDGNENVQGEQVVPSIKKNWFTSLFASNKQESTFEQGSSSQRDAQESDIGITTSSNLGSQTGQPSFPQKARSPTEASEVHVGIAEKNDTLEDEDKLLPFPRQKPTLNGKVTIGAGDKLDTIPTKTIDATMEQSEAYTSEQLKEPKSRNEVHINHENDPLVTLPPTQITNGESPKDSLSFSQQDGLKLPIFSYNGSPTLENSEESQILGEADKEAIKYLPTSVSALAPSDVVATPHQEQDVKSTIQTDSVVENKYTNFKSSKSGRFYPTEMSQHITTETKFEYHSRDSPKVDNISAVNGISVPQGKDAMITIDIQPPVSSQPMEGTILPTESATALQPATQTNAPVGERTEAGNEFQIEVVKSIVYGGLSESITSLSVVSSAVGGGAATLNILALGMANLIGGLFIVCHNLWELKSDRIEEVSNQVSNQVSNRLPEHRDRYKQLLGRRENFLLHAIIAITSYIVFGLVSPLVYAFSFRKADDKQLKLLVVAASSLMCIVFLAIGRAYVRRPPKPYIKSVTTYIILGFMVSGVSYAAGVLVERLLEKLGFFETGSGSGSVSNLVVPGMAKEGSAWASF